MCDEAGVFGVERQRNERLEAARFVLQLAEADEVVDAVVGLLDVAVEHRAVGAEAQLVGRAVDFEPAAGVGLVFADLVADLGMEDFGAAAGQAAEAGFDHVFEHLADGFFGQPAEPIDFDGRPGLEVQLGIGVVQQADDVDVPVVLPLVVQAADDVHLGAAVLDRLGAAGEDLLVAHHVALRVAQVGAERAEHAAIDADVRGVEVRVDVVVGEVAVLALADEVGQLAEFGQRHVGPLEHEAVVERQPLAGFDLFADGFQRWGRRAEHEVDVRWHGESRSRTELNHRRLRHADCFPVSPTMLSSRSRLPTANRPG